MRAPNPHASMIEAPATRPAPRSAIARCGLRWSVPVALAWVTSACFSTEIGLEPALDRINFPVGVALSSGGTRLYVASSNFDLRFDGGVVQVLDADVIGRYLPRSCLEDRDCDGGLRCDSPDGEVMGRCVDDGGSWCGALGEQTAAQRLTHPGPCGALPLSTPGLLLDGAIIAPFVADVRYVPASGDGRPARIVMPVRGDATLHWADVEDDVAGRGPLLDCGQRSDDKCDADHRRGDQSSEATPDGEGLPTEPFGIAVGDQGDVIFVGHQSQGAVSVFENGARGPRLRSVLAGLPANPMGLSTVPAPAVVGAFGLDYQPGVMVSYRFSGPVTPAVELLRYYDAEQSTGVPYLHRAGSGEITTNHSGADTRGIALDASERSACEQACACPDEPAQDDTACFECLMDCAAVPLKVFATNRSPDSLVIGRTRTTLGQLPTDDIPDFSDSRPLRGGPARVVAASVLDEAGDPSPRVFVLSFDAQLMYIYDPRRQEIEAHVKTGLGPQGLAIDPQRGLGYVAHFTDSYIGVVDLDKRHSTYGQVVLSVGEPQPPRSSK